MKKRVVLFTVISYLLIWTVGIGFRLSGADYADIAGVVMASGCMLIPLLTSLILQAVYHEPLFRGLGVCWRVNRWWLIGWLAIPALALLTMALSSWMPGMYFSTDNDIMRQTVEEMNASLPPDGSFGFTPNLVIAVTLLSGLFAGITINALFAFGEEAGWRGYLLKQFEGKHFMLAAVVIGVIWGFWHAPIILLGHNYPQHPVAGVFLMVGVTVALAISFQYFRIKSGSVLVAAIMHGTFNGSAGLAIVTIAGVDGVNDLLVGGCGVAGIVVLLLFDLLLFLFDRYVTKDRIMTSPLRIMK